jgi:hypothetical protein
MGSKSVPITRRQFFFADPFFASNWPNFEKVRDAVNEESGDVWKRLANEMQRQPCIAGDGGGVIGGDDIKK